MKRIFRSIFRQPFIPTCPGGKKKIEIKCYPQKWRQRDRGICLLIWGETAECGSPLDIEGKSRLVATSLYMVHVAPRAFGFRGREMSKEPEDRWVTADDVCISKSKRQFNLADGRGTEKIDFPLTSGRRARAPRAFYSIYTIFDCNPNRGKSSFHRQCSLKYWKWNRIHMIHALTCKYPVYTLAHMWICQTPGWRTVCRANRGAPDKSEKVYLANGERYLMVRFVSSN